MPVWAGWTRRSIAEAIFNLRNFNDLRGFIDGACLAAAPAITQRGLESLDYRPPPLDAAVQCRGWNPQVFGPLGQRSRLTPVGDSPIHSGVVVLLDARRPATVAWLVVPVVVNPVNRHPDRALSHVGEEVLEYLPAFTYPDASVTVDGGRGPSGSAPPSHRLPDPVGRRPPSARLTVGVREVRNLPQQAAARLSGVSHQTAVVNHPACAAFAAAEPAPIAVSVVTIEGENGEATKDCAGHFEAGWHVTNIAIPPLKRACSEADSPMEDG